MFLNPAWGKWAIAYGIPKSRFSVVPGLGIQTLLVGFDFRDSFRLFTRANLGMGVNDEHLATITSRPTRNEGIPLQDSPQYPGGWGLDFLGYLSSPIRLLSYPDYFLLEKFHPVVNLLMTPSLS